MKKRLLSILINLLILLLTISLTVVKAYYLFLMCKWFNVEALTGRSFSVSELFVFLFILKFITIPFSAYKDAVEKDEKTDLTQHTLDCIYIVTGLTITLSYALIISTLLY